LKKIINALKSENQKLEIEKDLSREKMQIEIVNL